MATFKPSYATEAAITITINSLANGSSVVSSAVDNSTNLYQDALIKVVLAGTAASTAWVDIRILPSTDNSTFADFDEGIVMPSALLASTPQTYEHFFSETGIIALPKYWKLAVKNQTGAAMSASGNSAAYQGIQMTSV